MIISKKSLEIIHLLSINEKLSLINNITFDSVYGIIAENAQCIMHIENTKQLNNLKHIQFSLTKETIKAILKEFPKDIKYKGCTNKATIDIYDKNTIVISYRGIGEIKMHPCIIRYSAFFPDINNRVEDNKLITNNSLNINLDRFLVAIQTLKKCVGEKTEEFNLQIIRKNKCILLRTKIIESKQKITCSIKGILLNVNTLKRVKYVKKS